MTLDYREDLRRALEERCQSNPRYSLRAFARDLEISPSRVSQVLQGKLGLSESSARQLAEKLGFSRQEREIFLAKVIATDSRSRNKRRIAELQLAQIEDAPSRTLELEAFRVISDWYHYAILELTTLKDFKSDHAWIARRLGISEHEAAAAVKRLRLLDLLEDRKGKWVQTEDNLVTPSGIPSEALKKFHSQVLQRASRAISTQTVNERDISSITVAINTDVLPKLKEKIKRFRRDFNRAVESSTEHKSPDEVYTLSIQLFRLTEKLK